MSDTARPVTLPSIVQPRVTPELLMAVMPACPRARAELWAPPLDKAAWESGITTAPRLAAWLAQLGEESGDLRWTSEIWGPTPEQLRYEGHRLNERPGDGYLFRGRGPIELTFRHNYELATRALGVDLVQHPDLACLPEIGSRIAGWYWQTHGCNELADVQDLHHFLAITHAINGGENGEADREAHWKRARAALGLSAVAA